MHNIVHASSVVASGEGGGIAPMIVGLIVAVFFIACMWKINTKAGKPGWACLIPFYREIVLLDIAGKPWWWLFLLWIPLVGLILGIMFMVGLANAFGKSTGFA